MNTLSKQLAQGPVLAPGVYDALSALAAEQAGFQALYLSGASIAYTRLGRSDVGLTTYSEVEDTLARIAERVRARIIVDADTGFGNALNVQRTVRGLERAGAAMIQLEDQTFPKRCGHLDGKSGAGRRDVRQAARRRGRAPITRDSDPGAYRRAGLGRAGRGAGTGRALSGSRRGRLVHRGPAQRRADAGGLRTLAGRAPLLANMVEGKDAGAGRAGAGRAGIRHRHLSGRHGARGGHTLAGYYGSLRQHGSTTPWRDRMLDFDGLNAMIGTPELLAAGKRYEA